MKKLINKLNFSWISAKTSLRNFVLNERGDTNFISIAIILIVIIAIAVVFIGFKDQILPKLESAIGNIMGKL